MKGSFRPSPADVGSHPAGRRSAGSRTAVRLLRFPAGQACLWPDRDGLTGAAAAIAGWGGAAGPHNGQFRAGFRPWRG
jgi:hypothetical protein